jgi:Xaa-Pro dipeptidase
MVRDRLRARAEGAGLDGLLLLAPGNLAYATGWMFSVNERPWACGCRSRASRC